MANVVDATGIHIKTQAELIAEYTADFLAIYGVDLTGLPSSNPDVQMMMTRVQAELDLEDLVVQVFTGMDPDQAIGTTLDQRCSINGVIRQAGTYTVTDITVVTNQDAITLPGLDSSSDPYTVQDNAGNKWELTETQTPATAGSYVYSFRSAVPGAVLTTINTITIPVSIVLGVASVNNPTTYTSLGINEETDAALRIRRSSSVSIASTGYVAALIAALQNINGVISANVHENTTDTVDSSGTPGHSIWVIIDGTAVDADIAAAIYGKRGAGCGLYGSETYNITEVDGNTFVIRWDFVAQQDLYIKFTATSLNGTVLPNAAAILAGIPTLFVPTVNQEVNINNLATIVQQIDPNCLVTASVPTEGFSASGTPGTYGNTLSPTTINKKFTVSSANISITVTPL